MYSEILVSGHLDLLGRHSCMPEVALLVASTAETMQSPGLPGFSQVLRYEHINRHQFKDFTCFVKGR